DPDDPYDNSTCYPTSDGQCTMQWAWAKVGAYQAWDLTTGSEAVKVAVVDTGIDIGNPDYIIPDPTGHEDLVTCRSIVTQNFVTTESNNDENGHGTHVAGTYGACIAVAATDEIDALASFSSYGADWVDVAAPGVRILSTMQDDYNTCFLCSWYGISPGYDAMSGTSMAAPHVSGLAALIWARG